MIAVRPALDTTKEKIVKMVQESEPEDVFLPWKDNYGSLYMALSVEE